jgi:hypothetical protein
MTALLGCDQFNPQSFRAAVSFWDSRTPQSKFFVQLVTIHSHDGDIVKTNV